MLLKCRDHVCGLGRFAQRTQDSCVHSDFGDRNTRARHFRFCSVLGRNKIYR